jgi:hypothetical protein
MARVTELTCNGFFEEYSFTDFLKWPYGSSCKSTSTPLAHHSALAFPKNTRRELIYFEDGVHEPLSQRQVKHD